MNPNSSKKNMASLNQTTCKWLQKIWLFLYFTADHGMKFWFHELINVLKGEVVHPICSLCSLKWSSRTSTPFLRIVVLLISRPWVTAGDIFWHFIMMNNSSSRMSSPVNNMTSEKLPHTDRHTIFSRIKWNIPTGVVPLVPRQLIAGFRTLISHITDGFVS